VRAAQAALLKGASALDATCLAVELLEDCPLFNAGHGAVFTHDETHELDAAVMDGATLAAGAIAGVCHVYAAPCAPRVPCSKTARTCCWPAGRRSLRARPRAGNGRALFLLDRSAPPATLARARHRPRGDRPRRRRRS
jgi:beta-aspartyl-peptidase (threonine type)